MSWPWLLAIPVVTALAALAGAAADAPAVAVGLAVLLGAAVSAGLAASTRRRVARLADHLHEVADGRADAAMLPGGPQWRQLEDALDALGQSVRERIEETRRVDAVRRDFVMNASHELKTPVAAIQALSESIELAFHRDPDRAKAMIGRLHTESLRLARMIRDLLDLARLEEPVAERGRAPVDVAEVARAQVERLSPLARDRGVALGIDAGDAATVLGLPEDVRLIVGNLLENAIRYNTSGGRADVAVRAADGRVVIEVADTGLGIPEADRDRIFERFYRVDKGRSRAAGGTGLGLALVRHAVQQAGGRIELETELGKGSTFTVFLPAEEARDAARAP